MYQRPPRFTRTATLFPYTPLFRSAFREGLADGAQVLIMGGGLVGTEFANDLSATGYQPVVVDMLGHPLAQLVPAGVGEAIRAALEEKAVVWHLGRKVVAINTAGSGIRADLDDGSRSEEHTSELQSLMRI